MRTRHSRKWVWWAYAMLAVVAAVLIAVGTTLRETVDAPWAHILGAVLQVATVIVGGLVSLAIQKRRRLMPPAEE
ncbi:hypothetical protein AB4Y63_12255 [Leifsonia sp. YAF41]|uniref:hypothetical protein n=1 Tax=Leifsonia sp. YAF41 TaxID=3233086 RepID=UPI003F98FE7E